MLFLGHIAVSVLLADLTSSDRKTVIAGNLIPDVVDKSGRLTGVFPYSRWLAHGLPALAVATAAARIAGGPKAARGIAVGYAGHLVCDLYLGGRVPWLFPLRSYPRQRRQKQTPWTRALYLLPEVLGAAYLCSRDRTTK